MSIWDFTSHSGYEGRDAEDFLAFSVIGWREDPRGFFNYILGILTLAGDALPAVALSDENGDQIGIAANPLIVSGSFAPGTQDINLAEVGGASVSSANPVPVQASVGDATASAVNPLPTQLSVANAVASATNPVPAQLSVANVAASAANPVPVQQYAAGGVTVPAGTAADPGYAFPGARTDAAPAEVEASRAFVIAGRACASVAMRDYAAVVWTILPTNLGTNTTLTITILSQSTPFAAGDALTGLGKVLADQLLSSATVATPAFALVAYTPTVSNTSVATLVVNQPIKIYCTKRDLYMGISVAGTAADGAYTVTALRMV